mgnify:CR=1 FL=1
MGSREALMDSNWKSINNQLQPLHQQLFRPIPSLLHSFETGEAFQHCTGCGKDLLAEKASYLVEKIFSKGEVIVEYAMCRDCLEPIRQEISAESKEAIQKFHKERRKIFQNLEKCNFCLQPVEELVGYKMVADCSGDQLFSLGHPTTLCGTCHGEMAEGISEKTKKDLDKHRDKFVPDPPQVAKDLPSVPLEEMPV